MAEVKGVGRRRIQHLDELRNRRRYWELKEDAMKNEIGGSNIKKKYKFSSVSPLSC